MGYLKEFFSRREDAAGRQVDKMREKNQEMAEVWSFYSSMKKPASQETIVAMLTEIQEIRGFISPECRALAAEAAGVKESVIDCIMKLYKSLKPAAYEHRITVCTGERCLSKENRKRQEERLENLKRRFGIQGVIPPEGALSADGTVLLETQNCLKHCRTAPNILLDGELTEYDSLPLFSAKDGNP